MAPPFPYSGLSPVNPHRTIARWEHVVPGTGTMALSIDASLPPAYLGAYI